MALHRLASITIGVPNVEETSRYYAEFGLSRDGACFSTSDGGERFWMPALAISSSCSPPAVASSWPTWRSALGAARNTKIHSAAGQADAGFIDLIDTFTHDRARAQAIYVAILGFAVASVMTSPAPAEEESRAFMRRVLGEYNLTGPAPPAG